MKKACLNLDDASFAIESYSREIASKGRENK